MEIQWSEMSLNRIKETLDTMNEESRLAACADLLHDSRKGVVTYAQKIQRAHERAQHERERLKKLWRFEEEARAEGYKLIIGTDEVGRGPLAGPVVAAAVVLAPGTELFGINDSKKLSEKRREMLAEEIRAKALAYQIAEVSALEIDRINILHAAELAMKKAIDALMIGDYVLVDGTNRLNISKPYRNLIGGDALSISIAAASILAKVHRDNLMVEYDRLYPAYGFAQNKGYGTADHYAALRAYGPCTLHRRSFRLE
ncbi:MAG: ribonuclease HII [Peptococcaceae bacterium]|nr:ribonuclease HII [Peptococcaceae bacterium]